MGDEAGHLRLGLKQPRQRTEDVRSNHNLEPSRPDLIGRIPSKKNPPQKTKKNKTALLGLRKNAGLTFTTVSTPRVSADARIISGSRVTPNDEIGSASSLGHRYSKMRCRGPNHLEKEPVSPLHHLPQARQGKSNPSSPSFYSRGEAENPKGQKKIHTHTHTCV